MKKCLIIENVHKEESSELGRSIGVFLEKYGITAAHYRLDQCDAAGPFKGNDFAVTLGGDGTVLYAARGCAPYGIPVFPVNLGEFGFIAGVQKNAWQQDLLSFIKGKTVPVGRNMIQVDVLHDGRSIFSSNALNDIVITSQICAQTLSFEVVYNHAPLGTFKADGIIVATATGSTAYSVSAGGPIVDPELDAFVLTPVNSFSLSGRPLVFNPDGELSVHILPWRNQKVMAKADGQKSVELTARDSIIITKAPQKALLVCCTIDNFYAALRSKLNWAGGPHA